MGGNTSCPKCGSAEAYTVYQEHDKYYYECKSCGCKYGHAQTSIPSTHSGPQNRCPACGKTEVDVAETVEGKDFFVCKSCGCNFWPAQPERVQSLDIHAANMKEQKEIVDEDGALDQESIGTIWLSALISGIILGGILGFVAWILAGGSMLWGGIVFVAIVIVRLLIEAVVGPKRSAESAWRMFQRGRETLSEQAEAMATARRAMIQAEVVQGLGKQHYPLQKERKRLFEEQLRLEEKKAKLEQELASAKGEMKLSIEKEIARLAKCIEMLEEDISKKDMEIELLLSEMRRQSM